MELARQRARSAAEVDHPHARASAHERDEIEEGLLPLGLEAFVLLRLPGVLGHASVPLQDVDDADAAATHHVAETDAGPVDLAWPRLAPELERRLPDLRQPRRAAGMAARDEPAVGRDRDASAGREVPPLDRGFRLPRAAEAEELVVL